METKRDLYAEDEIMTLEFDDGVEFEVGIMGVFKVDNVEYIALDSLNDDDSDIYLYRYEASDDDFELIDIPEEEFERVAQAFERLMEEPE